MKRTIIGGFIMIAGLLITMPILIAGSIYATEISAWSGSRFWFAIFGGRQYGDELVESLFLGIPFIIGIFITILGFVILGNEYYQTFQEGKTTDKNEP